MLFPPTGKSIECPLSTSKIKNLKDQYVKKCLVKAFPQDVATDLAETTPENT